MKNKAKKERKVSETLRRGRYNFRFILMGVIAILISYSAIAIGLLICFYLKYLSISSFIGMSPYLVLVLFLIGAIIIGIIIMAILGKTFLRPINNISKATQKVAKGDFSVQIEGRKYSENSEMGNLILNFNKMIRDLRRTETLRDDFIANVSHEFKTPLSTIQGYSTLLQDEDLSREERRAYTKYIIDATRQLSDLTGNILKLSKLENGEMDVTATDFDAAEQIRQAILFLEAQWSEKDIDLEIDLISAKVTANENLLMQVWQNIIGNAVKFCDKGGKIKISSEVIGDGYAVKISDNGCGMNEATKERIFEKFFQGDNSHSKEGNGLGLALVKEILDVSGGTVFVESTEGVGTEFTVTVPLSKPYK